MLFFFATCVSAALFSHFYLRQDQSAPPGDLFRVINTQLAAFRTDDYPRAYQQASLNFQQRFTVDQFKQMITADYARVLTGSRVEFGPVQFLSRRAQIQVFFIEPSGNVHVCIYSLVNEGEVWKVDGAKLMRPWPTSHRMTGVRS